MKHQMLILAVFITTLFLFSVITLSSSAQQEPQRPHGGGSMITPRGSGGHRKAPPAMEQLALQRIAEREGLPSANLEVTASIVERYRYSGKIAYKFDIHDSQTKKLYVLVLDDKGQEINEDQLEQEDLEAKANKYGKLTPELYEYLKNASPDKEVTVTVEVKLPPDTPDKPVEPSIDSNRLRNMTPDDREAFERKDEEFEKQLKAYHKNRKKKYVVPVMERLKRMGYEVTDFELSPRFSVKLKPAMVRELETWPEIREIHLVQEKKYKPELDISRRTIGADLVEGRGFDGTGVNVAQVEIGHRSYPVVGSGNPYLTGASQSNNYICPDVSEHAVAVAGIIRSTATLQPVFRGISPGVSLFLIGSCNAVDSELMHETDAAISLGYKIFNLSFGVDSGLVLQPLDKYYDEKVRFDRALIVKSAGNNGGGFGTGTGNVTSPGLGYNVITVGNFNDQNTQGMGR